MRADLPSLEFSQRRKSTRSIGHDAQLPQRAVPLFNRLPQFGAEAVGRERRRVDPIQPSRPAISNLFR